MEGFKSETEQGVKSSFGSLAKIAGVAFGGAALGSVIKSSLESAASAQTQGQAIRSEFGKAGESLVKFADTGAQALNATSGATEVATTKFGMLFRGMGIGQKQAALMTKQWEELGLSINKIRGGGVTGAAESLSLLGTAASGASTRGLRQLGISITAAQVAAQAFKDGFTSSITGALTPAQRAVATYQLATAQLPRYLALAGKHTNDFANVQARLTIAWDNAKTALGTALLPLFTRLGNEVGRWAARMEKSGKLQHDFNVAAHIAGTVIKGVVSAVTAAIHVYEALSRAVGGTRHVVELLVAAFAVAKFRAIGKAISADVGKALEKVRAEMVLVRAEAAKTAAAQQKGAAVGATAYKKSATEIDASMKTVGTTAKAEATKSKAALATVGTATKQVGTDMKVAAAETKGSFATMGTAATGFATTTKVQAAEAGTAIKVASVEAEGSFAAATTAMKVAAIQLGLTIKVALIQTGIGLLVVAIGIAVGYVLTHWETVKRYTQALGAAMGQVWRGIKEIVVGSVKLIGGGIVDYLIFPMKEFIDVAASATGWIPFLGDGVKKAASAVDGLFNSMKNLATNGKNQIIKGGSEIGQVGKAWNDSLAKSAKDPSSKKKLNDSGKAAAQSFSDGFNQSVNSGVDGVGKKLSDTLRNVIQSANRAIETSVREAKNNLDKIGQDLAKSIEKIQAKLGGAAGSVAGSPQGQAFAKLKKLIESGAPSFEIARARADLSTQLAGVGKAQKSALQTQLANLTSAFNKGKIGYSAFESRLNKILSENNASLKTALKAGGPAFADAYKAQVAALGKQARAIAAIPAKYRGIGGAGGAADIRIIQPLEVIKTEQLRVRVATQKAAAQQAAAAAKAAAQRALLNSTERASLSIQHHASTQRSSALAEAKHHTRLLARIANERLRGPAGPQGPFRPHTRNRGPEGPEGPFRPHIVAEHVRRAILANRGPAGPEGGFRPHVATRAGASAIRSAIQAHRGAVVQAVAGLGARMSAGDRALLAADLKLLEPIHRLRADQLRIGAQAERQRDHLIRSSERTNALLRRMEKSTGKHRPGYGKEPKGEGSHDARVGAKVGSRA